MKTAVHIIIIIICISAAALSADSPKQLNQQGLDLYRGGKYEDAAKKFRKALEINPRYGWAYYNLACTLGVIRKKGNICENAAFMDRIVEYLTLAAKYEPGVKEKFQKDPDLESIRNTTGYQLLLGLSLHNPDHLKLILHRVPVWYGPAPGSEQPASEFRILKNGTFNYWYLRADKDRGSVKVTRKGSWHLKGTIITLTFNKPFMGKKTYKGRLNKLGELHFEGIYGKYLDVPVECGS